MDTLAQPHDLVSLIERTDRWPVGTRGTVVEADTTNRLIVEIVDEEGRTKDLLRVARSAVDVRTTARFGTATGGHHERRKRS